MRFKRTFKALALRLSMSNYIPNSLRLALVKLGGGEVWTFLYWTASDF